MGYYLKKFYLFDTWGRCEGGHSNYMDDIYDEVKEDF